jgi:hypothetical protein
MAHKSLSFKKKQHFLQLIKDIPTDRILFCPIDVSTRLGKLAAEGAR